MIYSYLDMWEKVKRNFEIYLRLLIGKLIEAFSILFFSFRFVLLCCFVAVSHIISVLLNQNFIAIYRLLL